MTKLNSSAFTFWLRNSNNGLKLTKLKLLNVIVPQNTARISPVHVRVVSETRRFRRVLLGGARGVVTQALSQPLAYIANNVPKVFNSFLAFLPDYQEKFQTTTELPSSKVM